MVDIHRVRVTWDGFIGGPGVSTFYALNGPALLPDLHQFFSNLQLKIPADVNIRFPIEGDIIDPVTGNLTGAWTAGLENYIDCSGTGGYAAPVGCVVNWVTGQVYNNHRLKGKTYIVPLYSDAFDVDGSLLAGEHAGILSAAETLVTAAADNFVVWSRPVNNLNGGSALVLSTNVPDKAAILRSRRD